MAKITNHELFGEAKKCIAGGVNSPVRSFKAVGGEPIFIKSARGSKIYSEDGKEFIDYCMSWGALILGHANPGVVRETKKAFAKGASFGAPTKIETDLAKIIVRAIPSIEKIRLTNSGTEAVMGAIRLARAFTRKTGLIRFEGSYHGHADYLLNCPGVPSYFKRYTISLPYNNIKNVAETARRHKRDVAAIIVEPVAGNMGVVIPKMEFLKGLREIADRYNIVLIFDEVITGFRIALGGSQNFFSVKADLTCLGKIIGGGLPIGAFGGRSEIMRLLAPEGSVYQAGTFSGNPTTVTSGISTLEILEYNNPYEDLKKSTNKLCEEIRLRAKRYRIKLRINHIASMFNIFFTENDVMDLKTALHQDRRKFNRFFHGLLKEGIYFSPSSLEANFLSTAHSGRDLDTTVKAIDKVFDKLKRG